MIKTYIFAALLLVCGFAWAQSITCTFDNMIMYPTGQVRGEPNGIFREFRCPRGHTTWVKA